MKASRYVPTAVVLLISSFATYIYTTNPDRTDWKIVSIADGDSFTLSRSDRRETFRLYGIDCPEKTQPFAAKARSFTATMLSEGTIRVKRVDTDTYGRTIAWVYSDDVCINEALLANGLAWHYVYFSSDSLLAALEKEARGNTAGLWSEKDPLPPWEYRRRKKHVNGNKQAATKVADFSGVTDQPSDNKH